MNKQLFDLTAEDFARITDEALVKGKYVRGELFLAALTRHVPTGLRVLDFGSGPGRIALMAARAGYVVEGVDTSPNMVEVAKRQPLKGAELSFRLCRNDGSDLKPAHYDAVMCSSVIEYVKEPHTLLASFASTIKPGGTLLLTFSNKRSLWRAFARAGQAERPHYALQHNIWTFDETRLYLGKAGFEIIEKPQFLEASPFDKREVLRGLSSSPLVGILGFVAARYNYTSSNI